MWKFVRFTANKIINLLSWTSLPHLSVQSASASLTPAVGRLSKWLSTCAQPLPRYTVETLASRNIIPFSCPEASTFGLHGIVVFLMRSLPCILPIVPLQIIPLYYTLTAYLVHIRQIEDALRQATRAVTIPRWNILYIEWDWIGSWTILRIDRNRDMN